MKSTFKDKNVSTSQNVQRNGRREGSSGNSLVELLNKIEPEDLEDVSKAKRELILELKEILLEGKMGEG